MRILHVIGDLSPATGGPAKACVEMARAVAGRAHEVAIATTDFRHGAGTALAPARGVELHVFPLQRPRVWLASWPMRRALPHLIAAADLVHIHSLYLFHSWAAGTTARRLGRPYVLRPHGTLDPFIHRRSRLRKTIMDLWFQNRVLREADLIHYTSAEEMRLAEPYVQGAPGRVVPLGLELGEYAELPPPGTFRARHPEIGDRPILLFLGRLNFKKGLDVLIRAFALLVRQGRDLHLVLAGPDGGMEAKARGWIAQAGLQPRTSFTGMLSGRDKLAAFADAALFLLPSASENFGIAVVEAMACGTPVVISKNVNIWREIVGDGAGVAEPVEAERFAAAAARLLDDAEAHARMAEAARASVRARWDWSRVAVELERMYADVLAGARSDEARGRQRCPFPSSS